MSRGGPAQRETGQEAHQEFVERVHGLYRQAGANGWAALAAAACLVALMWPFAPAAMLLGWFAGYAPIVAGRIPLLRAFRADPRRDAH